MLFRVKTERHVGNSGARMISEGLKISNTLTELNLWGDRKGKKE